MKIATGFLTRRCKLRCFGRRLAADRSGSQLIELAAVLPVLMLLTTGMVACGMLLNSYICLTNAVGVGARALAFTRDQQSPALAASDPCAYAVSQLEASATNLNFSGITFSIVWSGSGSGTYAGTCPGLGAKLTAGDTVKLTATDPQTLSIFGMTSQSVNLTAESSELVQ